MVQVALEVFARANVSSMVPAAPLDPDSVMCSCEGVHVVAEAVVDDVVVGGVVTVVVVELVDEVLGCEGLFEHAARATATPRVPSTAATTRVLAFMTHPSFVRSSTGWNGSVGVPWPPARLARRV
jgi:hypothetical protein